jgi:cysteine synthase A
MHIHSDLADTIGNTPLLKLRKASEITGCTILGKAEFMNPGQSVKDRAALYIIKDAVAKGLLKPGGTIVEGTAGNTGIGLALVGASMGFRTVIVIPETQSQEKKDMLRLAGAELVQVPAAPYRNPNNYVRYSGRLAEALAKTEPNGAIWANQFDNTANRQAHIETTGPEIWDQTGGKVDGFICAVGSGGTLAGVAMALQPKGVKIGLADPEGAALHAFYTTGKLESPGSSITEGIGQGRITANLEGFTPDFSYRIPDAEALPIVFDLLQDEGLCMGGSTGINIAGAIRMARDMGPGKTIVTILCDYGSRYQSKVYNPTVLREKGLPVPDWLDRASRPIPAVFEDARGSRCRRTWGRPSGLSSGRFCWRWFWRHSWLDRCMRKRLPGPFRSPASKARSATPSLASPNGNGWPAGPRPRLPSAGPRMTGWKISVASLRSGAPRF